MVEEPQFTYHEVVAASNALVAIIDWPEDTVALQKNLQITPDTAKKLMNPLHPLWDLKIDEISNSMATWDVVKITELNATCDVSCECEFLVEAIEKRPEILQRVPDLKMLSERKLQRTKQSTLSCTEKSVPLQKIISFLMVEQKKYEAEAAH
jgi:hypothetical protein